MARMESLTVELQDRSYPIYIGGGLLSDPNMFLSHIPGDTVMVVTNETVAPLYLERLQSTLSNKRQSVVVLPDGEQYKNLEILNRVFTALLEERHGRDTTLVALGGGVVGDMAGFAAASYQRGVHFVQVPTTLLAQVDSSVGGKTGVNHPLGKNMIGAFYQPRCVVIDTETLNTLDDRQLSAGIAEVVKYGLLGDLEFFVWLEDHMDALLERDPETLATAIRRSCGDKAGVVAADERERSGHRALLNLGHTFGHAIETGMGYGQWLHGEAVACGMAMAADMSAHMGWLKVGDVERVRELLARARLPVNPPEELSSEDFLRHMSVDKKVEGGQLRLVLMREIGSAHVSADFDRDALLATLGGRTAA